MIRKTIASWIAAAAIALSSAAAESDPQTLFPYPEPPDRLVTLTERTNYVAEHFWERCDLNAIILRPADLRTAMADYLSLLPYADRDTALKSIDRLIAAYAKNPDHLLRIAETAEDMLYGDGGEYRSDELFLPFARAVASCKKIPSARKARLAHEATVVGLTLEGGPAPDFSFTTPGGEQRRLTDSRGKHTLIFFNDPRCEECALARVRLSADPNINQLIDEGLIDLLSILPDEPDLEWSARAAGYNRRWLTGWSAEIDDLYDLRNSPAIYYLDPEGVILSKNASVDILLQGFGEAVGRMRRADNQRER